MARRHEQAVAVAAAEAEIGATLRQRYVADRLTLRIEDAHAVELRCHAPAAPQVAVDVAAKAVRRAVRTGEDAPPGTDDGAPLPGEEILLDGNEVAGDSPFFSLGAFSVSPDGRLLAYSTDFAGDERFTLRIKDLVTGETAADEIPGASLTLPAEAFVRLIYGRLDDEAEVTASGVTLTELRTVFPGF